MAGKIGELYVEISADLRDIQAKFTQLKKKLDDAGEAVKKVGDQAAKTSQKIGGLKGFLEDLKNPLAAIKRESDGLWKQFAIGTLAAQGIQSAINFVTSELKSIVTEAMAAETAASRLETVLASTKGATGLTKDELVKMATALQDVTTYSDETVMAAEAVLLRFEEIGRDVFPQALEAATNVAAALGTDLASAAEQVGKALQDPITATRMLRSMNILLTEAQKNTIKSLMNMGDVAGAQKIILDELKTAFGGAAKAAGETFAGKLAILNNKYSELKEQIGLAILPLLTQFIDMIKPIVDDLVTWVEQNKNLITAGAQLITNLEGLALAFKILKEILEASWTVYEKTIGQLDKLGTIGRGVKNSLLLLPAVLDMLADKTKNAGDAVGLFGIVLDVYKRRMEAADAATRNTYGGFKSLEDMAAALNITLKSQLIAEIDATERALKALKGTIEATPGAIAALNDKILKLKTLLVDTKDPIGTLQRELGILTDQWNKYKDRMPIGEQNELKEKIISTKIAISELKSPLGELNATFNQGQYVVKDYWSEARKLTLHLRETGDALLEARNAAWNFLHVPVDQGMKRWVPPMEEVNDKLGNLNDLMDEAFTYNDAKRIEEITTLLAEYGDVMPIRQQRELREELESLQLGDFAQAWRQLKDAVAQSVSDMVMSIVGLGKALDLQAQLYAHARQKQFEDYWQGMEDAAERAYDAVRQAANDAFSEQELLIKRAEEDEDIRYRREYEAQQEAIKNSTASAEEKEAALKALEIKYEEEKLARERKREDEKLAREKQHKADLLAMELQHEKDLQKIRDDAEKARIKFEQDELDRQNSLWNKIKGIALQAIDDIIKKWVTDLLENVLKKKTADAAGEAVGGLGKTFTTGITSLATSIGTAITGLATAVATGIVTIATGIATVIVTLATAIASAATILAAAAPALLIVGGIALALYAGFSLIGKLLGGGGGGNSDITYWLKFITDSSRQTADWLRISYMGYVESWDSVFESMRYCLYEIHGRIVETRDAIGGAAGSIVETIKGMKGYQSGGYVAQTQLALVHAGEYVLPREAMSGGGQVGPGAGGPVSVRANIPDINIAAGIKQIILEIVPKLSEQGILQFHVRGLKYV